jgi:hypothetical protein
MLDKSNLSAEHYQRTYTFYYIFPDIRLNENPVRWTRSSLPGYLLYADQDEQNIMTLTKILKLRNNSLTEIYKDKIGHEHVLHCSYEVLASLFQSPQVKYIDSITFFPGVQLNNQLSINAFMLGNESNFCPIMAKSESFDSQLSTEIGQPEINLAASTNNTMSDLSSLADQPSPMNFSPDDFISFPDFSDLQEGEHEEEFVKSMFSN